MASQHTPPHRSCMRCPVHPEMVLGTPFLWSPSPQQQSCWGWGLCCVCQLQPLSPSCCLHARLVGTGRVGSSLGEKHMPARPTTPDPQVLGTQYAVLPHDMNKTVGRVLGLRLHALRNAGYARSRAVPVCLGLLTCPHPRGMSCLCCAGTWVGAGLQPAGSLTPPGRAPSLQHRPQPQGPEGWNTPA